MKSGFTFFEVLLCLFILSVALGVLSNLQMRGLFRVQQDEDEIGKVFLVKQRLYHYFFRPHEQEQFRPEKPIIAKYENPEITIATELVEINTKSSLKPFRDTVLILQAEGSWVYDLLKRRVKMVTLVLKPPKEEKEKR
jgi:prepilin-type N-terminal cleavage/methylation domain-containing protein